MLLRRIWMSITSWSFVFAFNAFWNVINSVVYLQVRDISETQVSAVLADLSPDIFVDESGGQ